MCKAYFANCRSLTRSDGVAASSCEARERMWPLTSPVTTLPMVLDTDLHCGIIVLTYGEPTVGGAHDQA